MCRYHASGLSCTLCRGSANAYLLPVLCVVAVLVAAAGYYVAKRLDTTKFVSAAKVLVSYLVWASLINAFRVSVRLISYLLFFLQQVMGSSSSTYVLLLIIYEIY